MDAEFWLQRWHEGRIGFHRDEVMPLLERHWAALGVYAGGRVFVTSLGHTPELYNDARYLEHLYGGIWWAATGNGIQSGEQAH